MLLSEVCRYIDLCNIHLCRIEFNSIQSLCNIDISACIHFVRLRALLIA